MVLLGVPLLDTLCFYASVLALKMSLMSSLTTRTRISKNLSLCPFVLCSVVMWLAVANPEDAKGSIKVRVDEDVERVRRAHLNDLENIPIFIIVCTLYLLTEPSLLLAANLIRIFTLARIVYTILYTIVVVPQPARGIVWAIGYSITSYMAVMSLIHFMPFM